MQNHVEPDVAALRLILSNVVARLVGVQEDGGRGMLNEMADQCKLAAEHERGP